MKKARRVQANEVIEGRRLKRGITDRRSGNYRSRAQI